MHQVCSILNRSRLAAPLALRVMLGGLFTWHGIDRFDTGISMVEAALRSWDVPAPGLTAPLTAVVAIVAGAALVAGIGTRIAAMLLSVVSIGVIICVKQDLSIISSAPIPGAGLDLALLAGNIALILHGPGRISLDHQLGIEPPESSDQRKPAYAA